MSNSKPQGTYFCRKNVVTVFKNTFKSLKKLKNSIASEASKYLNFAPKFVKNPLYLLLKKKNSKYIKKYFFEKIEKIE